jgi:hypothetical protein
VEYKVIGNIFQTGPTQGYYELCNVDQRKLNKYRREAIPFDRINMATAGGTGILVIYKSSQQAIW